MEPKDRLRVARKKAKLSVEVVASRTHISASGVRAHENGQNGIRPEVAEAYAAVLRVSPSWILYGEGEAPGEHHDEVVKRATADESSPGVALDAITPPDYVEIEVLPTYAGMGGGGTGEGDATVALMSRSLVERELRAEPYNLLVINVRGDSMEPLFRHGDQLVIDKRDVNPIQPGPFALLYDEGYVVKNVQRIPRSSRYRIFSSNPAYAADEAEAEDVRIMGRPVWFARRL